jgi:hypothetical protein
VGTSIENTLRLTLVIVLPMIVLVFLYVGARNHQRLNAGRADVVGVIDILGAVLTGVQLAVGLSAWRLVRGRTADVALWSSKIKRYSGFFLGICFISSVATALITSVMPPCGQVSLWISAGILTFSSIAMVTTSVHVAAAR